MVVMVAGMIMVLGCCGSRGNGGWRFSFPLSISGSESTGEGVEIEGRQGVRMKKRRGGRGRERRERRGERERVRGKLCCERVRGNFIHPRRDEGS